MLFNTFSKSVQYKYTNINTSSDVANRVLRDLLQEFYYGFVYLQIEIFMVRLQM